MKTYILGIESSCDETSASICYNGKIINNIVASQKIHSDYGGVVPELASRAHQQNIIPVVATALKETGIGVNDLSAIAVTQGPGLLGALLVGYSFTKSLSFALGIPFINVHHMKAHIAAHFIDDPQPDFPFLCLTVSGGHTQIVLVSDHTAFKIIGQTRDDAVGEAFDKGAKLLGLPYPGGPEIDRYARKGDPKKYSFSKSDVPDFDFSFSGIKTSLLYFLKDRLKDNPEFIRHHISDICAAYQSTLIDMLMHKFVMAAKKYNVKHVGIAGGVAANSQLRTTIEKLGKEYGWQTYLPEFQYCTDNAGMIAMAGYHQFKANKFGKFADQPKPRMPFL